MTRLQTIEVCQEPGGWRVERCGTVLLPTTTQDAAMVAALEEASTAFDLGETVQVVVVMGCSAAPAQL